MDPVNPWLDTAEVRRMAERLMQPVREVPASRNDMGFDSSFVGFSTDDPEQNVRPQDVMEPASVPSPPVRVLPSSEIFRLFRERMTREFGVDQFFILNWEGNVLYDQTGLEKFYFLARHVRQTSAGSHLRIKLRAKATLEVIPAHTPAGVLVMGALAQEPIRPDVLAKITMVLENAFAL